jgi:hypothetical protein
MTAAPALAFPASKALAGWWRHLAPYKPSSIWIAHLVLHRVEAPVIAQQPSPVDSLGLFVLKAVAVTPGATASTIAELLDLPAGFVRQVLNNLAADHLVYENPDSSWAATASGAEAIEHGIYTRAEFQRRPFYFVETEQAAPPQYLHLLNHPAMTDWHAHDAWRFDVNVLHNCLAEPVQWKTQRRFPDDVLRVAALVCAETSRPAARADWQSIILDQPRHLLALLMTVGQHSNAQELLGFAIQQESLALKHDTPAFQLSAPWQQVFPALAQDPSLDQWRQAWHDWCRPRGLLLPEGENCPLERRGFKLRATLSNHLISKLRDIHSEVLHGDTWLLAGSGRTRAAATVQIVEQAS